MSRTLECKITHGTTCVTVWVWKIAVDQDSLLNFNLQRNFLSQEHSLILKRQAKLGRLRTRKKNPLNWKLNKPDMKTTEPQQTILFIQRDFSTANPTLRTTIHRLATKLPADNAFKGKKHCTENPENSWVLVTFYWASCTASMMKTAESLPAVHRCKRYF